MPYPPFNLPFFFFSPYFSPHPSFSPIFLHLSFFISSLLSFPFSSFLSFCLPFPIPISTLSPFYSFLFLPFSLLFSPFYIFFFFVLFFLYLFPYPLCRSLPFLFFLSALSFSFFLFPSNSFCLGDGKTHYIQQQLASSPASLTIAINEAFTPVNAISKLRSLPFSLKDCVIFFNFTMLPPGVRIGREGGKVDARLLVYKEIGFVKQTQL